MKYPYGQLENGLGVQTHRLINDALKNIESDIVETNQRINGLVTTNGNSNAEIVDARGTYVTLKERLDTERTSLQSQITELQKPLSSKTLNNVQLFKNGIGGI